MLAQNNHTRSRSLHEPVLMNKEDNKYENSLKLMAPVKN